MTPFRSIKKGKWIETLKLRLYSIFNIPMIAYTKPVIVEVSDEKSHIIIPLIYRTKNHIGTMYFGSLSVGADLCMGLIGVHHIRKTGRKIVWLFKDFKADFIKTGRSDVHFICDEGKKIEALVDKVIQTGERQNETLNAYATSPDTTGDEVIAKFKLTLSLKEYDK